MEYDKDNISESTVKKLKKYIENPDFNAEAVAKVSKVKMLIFIFYFSDLAKCFVLLYCQTMLLRV